MLRLISVDVKAEFGFLKKPDINESVYLTYNMLHKPALLGILGAIAGLPGYGIPGAVPEYRKQLNGIKVGIKPLSDEENGVYGDDRKGNFRKDIIQYINGVGYASQEQGGILIIKEQTLVKPAYRCFILLDEENEQHSLLRERLHAYEAEYVPYLGKNEHQLWWENYTEWEQEPFKPGSHFRIDSLFKKTAEEKLDKKEKGGGMRGGKLGTFMYFERLPLEFDTHLPQYRLAEFVYTDFELAPDNEVAGLVLISNREREEKHVIQLF